MDAKLSKRVSERALHGVQIVEDVKTKVRIRSESESKPRGNIETTKHCKIKRRQLSTAWTIDGSPLKMSIGQVQQQHKCGHATPRCLRCCCVHVIAGQWQ